MVKVKGVLEGAGKKRERAADGSESNKRPAALFMRLTREEHALLVAAAPPMVPLAVWARVQLLKIAAREVAK